LKNLAKLPGGLYSGLGNRVFEGSLMGGSYLVASRIAKASLLKTLPNTPKLTALLVGGIAGGLAQSVIMTPCNRVLTHTHDQKESTVKAIKSIYKKAGFQGYYAGFGAVCARQITNWGSRTTFTELARTTLGLSQYGLAGEVASGIVAGVAACWNTPLETLRVSRQVDASNGRVDRSYGDYVKESIAKGGVGDLFKGVRPRCLQSVWQTVWMVVVPNVMGF
jgi:hypothetical protein